jgi:hypothetical protein
VLEADVAGHARGVAAAGCGDRLGREGQDLADTARADDRLLQRARRVGDRRQRIVDGGEIGDDDEEAPDGEGALEDVQAADDEDERGA